MHHVTIQALQEDFFEHNDIPTMVWPAQSPDLNPIENICLF